MSATPPVDTNDVFRRNEALFELLIARIESGSNANPDQVLSETVRVVLTIMWRAWRAKNDPVIMCRSMRSSLLGLSDRVFSNPYWSDIFVQLCGLFELKMCDSRISIHHLETFQGVVPDDPIVHFHAMCFGSILPTKSCESCNSFATSLLEHFDWNHVLMLVRFFKQVALMEENESDDINAQPVPDLNDFVPVVTSDEAFAALIVSAWPQEALAIEMARPATSSQASLADSFMDAVDFSVVEQLAHSEELSIRSSSVAAAPALEPAFPLPPTGQVGSEDTTVQNAPATEAEQHEVIEVDAAAKGQTSVTPPKADNIQARCTIAMVEGEGEELAKGRRIPLSELSPTTLQAHGLMSKVESDSKFEVFMKQFETLKTNVENNTTQIDLQNQHIQDLTEQNKALTDKQNKDIQDLTDKQKKDVEELTKNMKIDRDKDVSNLRKRNNVLKSQIQELIIASKQDATAIKDLNSARQQDAVFFKNFKYEYASQRMPLLANSLCDHFVQQFVQKIVPSQSWFHSANKDVFDKWCKGKSPSYPKEFRQNFFICFEHFREARRVQAHPTSNDPKLNVDVDGPPVFDFNTMEAEFMIVVDHPQTKPETKAYIVQLLNLMKSKVRNGNFDIFDFERDE